MEFYTTTELNLEIIDRWEHNATRGPPGASMMEQDDSRMITN
jgi:hypothetical protein